MHYSSDPRVIPHPLPEVNFLMVEIPTPKPCIFMIRVTRQIKCLIAQAPGGHTPPHTWSELFNGWDPHPLSHIYLWSGWIDNLYAPRVEARGHPHPLPEVFFENYTYLWNHFVNFNQTLPKCSLGDPLPKLRLVCLGSKEGPKRGPKMIVTIFFLWTSNARRLILGT